MSRKTEIVREVAPIGGRAWYQCDGCGKKGPAIEHRFNSPREADPPHFANLADPPPGWAVVFVVLPEGNERAFDDRLAHLCERCWDFSIASALELVAK